MEDFSQRDERTLRALLDSSMDYEERRQIRAALRKIKKQNEENNKTRQQSDTDAATREALHKTFKNIVGPATRQGRRTSIVERFSSAAERRASFHQRWQMGLVFTKEDGKAAAKEIEMASKNVYEEIDNEEELNQLLSEAKDVDKRVQIRAALRKLKEKKQGTKENGYNHNDRYSKRATWPASVAPWERNKNENGNYTSSVTLNLNQKNKQQMNTAPQFVEIKISDSQNRSNENLEKKDNDNEPPPYAKLALWQNRAIINKAIMRSQWKEQNTSFSIPVKNKQWQTEKTDMSEDIPKPIIANTNQSQTEKTDSPENILPKPIIAKTNSSDATVKTTSLSQDSEVVDSDSTAKDKSQSNLNSHQDDLKRLEKELEETKDFEKRRQIRAKKKKVPTATLR